VTALLEERGAQRAFQLLDGQRQRGLAPKHGGGGGLEAAMLDHGHEMTLLGDFDVGEAFHLSIREANKIIKIFGFDYLSPIFRIASSQWKKRDRI
jgi:hypothetical protein